MIFTHTNTVSLNFINSEFVITTPEEKINYFILPSKEHSATTFNQNVLFLVTQVM